MTKKIFLLFLGWCWSLAWSLGCLAQPCFTTDVRKGCSPLNITVTNCSPTTDSRLVFYEYGDGSTAKTSNTHTYTKAGKYFIKQYINSNPGQQSDGTYLIEVLEPETPRFLVEYCGANTVIVKVLTNGMPAYQIDYGDGEKAEVGGLTSTTHRYADNQQRTIVVASYIPTEKITCGTASQSITPLAQVPPAEFKEVRILPNNAVQLSFTQTKPYSYKVSEFSGVANALTTIDLADNGVSSLTLPNRNLQTDKFIYRVNPFDQCRNAVTASAEGIPTLHLTVEAKQKQNVLQWDLLTTAGFVSYQIYRNNTLLQTITEATTKTFIDEKVTCNELYQYRVELNLFGGKSKSISATQNIKAASARVPVAVTQFSASTEQNAVRLRWQYPKEIVPTKVLITKQFRGQTTTIQQNAKNTENDFVYDLLPTTQEQACYTLVYIDECGNQSAPSPTLCNMVLTGTENGNTILLNWQANVGNQTAQFVIEKINLATNQVVNTSPVAGNGNLTEDKTQQDLAYFGYRLRTIIGNDTLRSNLVPITMPIQVAIPTAFSPNGDGLNDTFKPLIRYVLAYQLQIFNQWGQVIFETNDPNQAWDGNIAGGTASTGVYISQVFYRAGNGDAKTLVNPLTIIR